MKPKYYIDEGDRETNRNVVGFLYKNGMREMCGDKGDMRLRFCRPLLNGVGGVARHRTHGERGVNIETH